MEEVPDAEHLAFAISQGRAVLSFNRGDFVQLHKQYAERGWEHHGIIVSPQFIRTAWWPGSSRTS